MRERADGLDEVRSRQHGLSRQATRELRTRSHSSSPPTARHPSTTASSPRALGRTSGTTGETFASCERDRFREARRSADPAAEDDQLGVDDGDDRGERVRDDGGLRGDHLTRAPISCGGGVRRRCARCAAPPPLAWRLRRRRRRRLPIRAARGRVAGRRSRRPHRVRRDAACRRGRVPSRCRCRPRRRRRSRLLARARGRARRPQQRRRRSRSSSRRRAGFSELAQHRRPLPAGQVRRQL